MPPSAELVKVSLEKVLASPLFSKADRQSRFLRYVVERQLAGDEDSLKEISIGFTVYERPASYDPKADPIVRVEASRLRARLREYYETAPPEDAIRIQLPKGSYVPAYEWREPVEEAPATAAEPAPTPPPQLLAPVEPSARRMPWIVPAAIGTLLLVGSLVVWYGARQAAKVKPIESIAVLPFADLSEKKDLAYLTDGLTEQIQDEFTRIRDLRVVGIASARQAAANPDLRAAARQLNVDALLRGSVRTEEHKVRVAVQLYDGNTGAAIWSGSFDGERTQLFQLEEQIARGLAAKLEIQLAVRREGVDARNAPQRAQAHEYYEQGRTLLASDSGGTVGESYRLFQLALTTDPTYAAPHLGVASVLIVTRGELGGPDGKKRALDEANKALELDPGLLAAHAVRIAYYRDVDPNLATARALCSESLRKYPNAFAVLDMCATVEGDLLEFPKEVDLARRGVEADPLSARAHSAMMLTLYRAGRFDEALSEADAAVHLGLQSLSVERHRALILAAKGDLKAALQVVEDGKARLGGIFDDWAAVRGYILGRMGRRAEAEQLIRDYTREGANSTQLSVIYIGLGDYSKAVDLLTQGLEIDRAQLAHTIAQYYARVLDGDPRFEAIKRQLGIPPH